MRVQFLRKFSKDLDKITKPKDKKAILQVIQEVKEAEAFVNLQGTKKLSGFQDAYRFRVGNYRIGVFLEGDLVIFARVAHRKQIYRIFP